MQNKLSLPFWFIEISWRDLEKGLAEKREMSSANFTPALLVFPRNSLGRKDRTAGDIKDDSHFTIPLHAGDFLLA